MSIAYYTEVTKLATLSTLYGVFIHLIHDEFL